MARVFGMHELELRPGVTPEAFEQFVVPALRGVPCREGQILSILKGDRGERAGKYVFVFEYDSVEQRDRDSPGSNQDSDDLMAWLAANRATVGAFFERLSTFVVPDWDIGMHYTDYVVLGDDPAARGASG